MKSVIPNTNDLRILSIEPNTAAYACNPRTWEAKVEGF